MNLKRKISEMGFRKCQFHKEDYDSNTRKKNMVPDIMERKSKYDYTLKKWIYTEKKIEHPKWSTFYILEMHENLKVWMLTEKDIIRKVWLQSSSLKEYIGLVHDSNSRDARKIKSKMDIIKLFPREIQRDFILADLLNGK